MSYIFPYSLFLQQSPVIANTLTPVSPNNIPVDTVTQIRISFLRVNETCFDISDVYIMGCCEPTGINLIF